MALSPDEKQELAKKISRGVQVVCSSIAQLHLSSPDPKASVYNDESGMIASLREHGADRWKFTNIEGALLLTKDTEGICHFRIYDLQEFRLRFQYELYENMDYNRLGESFHCFEMENCVCGFNFSSPSVAAKFFDRVQNYIVRVQQRAPPRVPERKNKAATVQGGYAAAAGGSFKQTAQSSLNGGGSFMNRSFNGNANSSFNARGTNTNTNNMFLGNGMLDPDNVPDEWKHILKSAGIRKKDLRNPEMFNLIQNVLAEHDIALNPPDELDYDDERLEEYYNPEQLAAWRRYQEDMRKFEEDQRRYERELEEYNRQQAQQEKLGALFSQQPNNFSNGNQGLQNLRQSVMHFQGKDIQAALALPNQQMQPRHAPRQSVARPALPALPVVPKKGVLDDLKAGARQSKVMIKANFLQEINNKGMTKKDLRRVSALPNIKPMGQGKAMGILETLKERLAEQRVAVVGDNDGENSSFSSFDE